MWSRELEEGDSSHQESSQRSQGPFALREQGFAERINGVNQVSVDTFSLPREAHYEMLSQHIHVQMNVANDQVTH